MEPIVLRDSEEAYRFLAQSLWRDQAASPTRELVERALAWAYEIAAAGHPLPPVRLIADVGGLALGHDRSDAFSQQEQLAVPGWPSGLSRRYEDFVLGKLYADWSFERGADALCRYQGRDRNRGLAFLIDQFRRRAGFAGVEMSPAVIKTAQQQPHEDFLQEGWASLSEEGFPSILAELYEDLIGKVRFAPEALGPEDIFELERGTALAEFSQRVALRQVLKAAARIEEHLPRHRVAPAVRRSVPTRILDEDVYPVGGYASISTRGSIESLLQSQLAYIEPEKRPDLFDIKFLRDELLYYSRDENQFLRQRRSIVLAVFPDLVEARFKDTELPYQRMVLLLAGLYAGVRKLTDWLSDDALRIEFLFLDREAAEEKAPLAPEMGLLEMLLQDQIANGTVHVGRFPMAEVAGHAEHLARRSLCHLLTVATADQPLPTSAALLSRLKIAGPVPQIGMDDFPLFVAEADGPPDAFAWWAAAVENLLSMWV